MNTFKKEILNLLFVSINKDVDTWTYNYDELSKSTDYLSPDYNGIKLNVDLKKKKIYILQCLTSTYIFITNYGFFTNFKIYLIVKKLTNHFKNRELKTILCKLEESFPKEIRKQKLIKINKNENK